MKRTSYLLGCVVLLGLAGCDSLVGPYCSQEMVPGVVARVVDARDDEPIQGGLSGTVSEVGYVEEMDRSGHTLHGAWERGGSYEVTVEAEGYETAHLEGIQVLEGRCHVRSVELTVELDPAD